MDNLTSAWRRNIMEAREIKTEMNNLQRYVEYVQPVVDVIEKYHNTYHSIQYQNVSAEDIYAEGGYIEFRDRNNESEGDIPVIHANTREESGGHLMMKIAPEQRELLSPEVLSVIHGDGWNTDWKQWWNKTADQTVYLLMDHGGISERDFTGFYPSDEFADTVDINSALRFITHRLGLNYLIDISEIYNGGIAEFIDDQSK